MGGRQSRDDSLRQIRQENAALKQDIKFLQERLLLLKTTPQTLAELKDRVTTLETAKEDMEQTISDNRRELNLHLHMIRSISRILHDTESVLVDLVNRMGIPPQPPPPTAADSPPPSPNNH